MAIIFCSGLRGDVSSEQNDSGGIKPEKNDKINESEDAKSDTMPSKSSGTSSLQSSAATGPSASKRPRYKLVLSSFFFFSSNFSVIVQAFSRMLCMYLQKIKIKSGLCIHSEFLKYILTDLFELVVQTKENGLKILLVCGIF